MMSRRIATLVFACAATSAWAGDAKSGASGAMPWAKDEAAARKAAADGGKLMMIDFYADW